MKRDRDIGRKAVLRDVKTPFTFTPALTVYFFLLIAVDGVGICNSIAECGVYAILVGGSRSLCAVSAVYSSLLLKVRKRD